MLPQKTVLSSTSPVLADESDFDLSLSRTLVPLKDMSEAHLLELLQGVNLEVICAGQTIFTAGSFDNQKIYLFHGDVKIIDESGADLQVKGRSMLMPLADHQPRLVTAIAQTDCSLLRLDAERLDKMLAWSQVADYLQLNISREPDLDEDADWMMTVLKSNLFFKVPPINVEEIFSRLKTQVVYAGDVIIRQGEIGDQCYFIKEGQAEVWRNEGAERTLLATIGVGRCFGEDALVNETVRNANVIMRSDGVLMRLDKQDFYRLLKEPEVLSLSLEGLEEKFAQGAVAVDVRSEEEYSELHLRTAVNIPLNILGMKARMLDKNRAYIFYCNTGRRSRAAAHLLSQKGYQAFALENCAQLFSQSQWQSHLENQTNYVIRDGLSVKGN